MFNLNHAVMKNFIHVSLINSVSRCISELSKLQTKIISSVSKSDTDPSDFNKEEYFESNVEVADFLNCSVTTVNRLKKSGALSSFRVGGRSWFKIAQVLEAVKNNPHLMYLGHRGKNPKQKMKPKLITRVKAVSAELTFIYLTYQGWHCTVCASSPFTGNTSAIEALCYKVINLQHQIKPFNIAPNEN
jgi:hypothetical protein